jgi:hypothetical protein
MNRISRTAKKNQERRESGRLHVRTPVRIFVDDSNVADSFIMLSSNISPDGVFLNSDLLFPEGEELDLEFVVPGEARPFRGRGRVVRVETSAAGMGPGMAVHVSNLDSDEGSS